MLQLGGGILWHADLSVLRAPPADGFGFSDGVRGAVCLMRGLVGELEEAAILAGSSSAATRWASWCWLVRDVLDKRGDRRLDLMGCFRRLHLIAASVAAQIGDGPLSVRGCPSAVTGRNQGPGGSLPGPDAGQPLRSAGNHEVRTAGRDRRRSRPQSRLAGLAGDVCRPAGRLPEALDRRPAVQRDDLLGLAGPVHEGRQVLPALPRQPPVLDHAGR
jgi:hypothetical protein